MLSRNCKWPAVLKRVLQKSMKNEEKLVIQLNLYVAKDVKSVINLNLFFPHVLINVFDQRNIYFS